MYLSKFLSDAGVASRRKVVDLIKQGEVLVNGCVITQPGFVVQETDRVTCAGAVLTRAVHVYILFNKPAGYITSARDEQGRATIFDVLKLSKSTRVFSVGRLDKDTTGLLLLTNDGALAQKLAHPRYNVSKSYNVRLDRPILPGDLARLRSGILLRDGFIKPDAVSAQRLAGVAHPSIQSLRDHSGRAGWGCFTREKAKPGRYRSKRANRQSFVSEVVVRLHSGKKRIVRRMFAALGYHVTHLDRFEYAGLTKRGLKIGTWRVLSKIEIAALKKLS